MESTKQKIIIAIIVIVLCALGVTLWVVTYHPFDDSYKTVTVQLIDDVNNYDKTYTVRTNAASLAELIEQNDKWGVVYTEGSYGAYITGINNKAVDTAHWVSILTSDNQYIDGSASYNTEYTASNKVVCISATVGADSLGLKDGQTYILIVLANNW